MKKRLISLLCVAAMAVSLIGCGDSGKKEETKAPEKKTETEAAKKDDTKAATEAPEETRATKNKEIDTSGVERALQLSKDPGEYKIHVYWPAPDTYFEDNIQPGYEQLAKEYGLSVDYAIGTEWTQDVENQVVEAKAAEGYDLFMIYGADTSGANALYKELIDAGCQVVNYGGKVDDPQQAAATVCGDVYDYSYAATKQMIEAMGGKGEIINVLENLGDVNTLERQKGVEAAVAEADGVTICQTIGDINTEEEGYEKVSDALAANPNATGIIATGGTASRGMTNALKDYYASNGDAKHLFAVATDPSQEVMNGLKDGTLDIGVAQNGYGQGYIGTLLLLYLSEGWTMKDPGVHIVTGYVFITTDNIDTFTADIETLSKDIAAELETKYLNAP
ncbi:MAG: sugar ABC transporter substrate-binding protein [Lachnospiraceae bacterium]|nr:sugar ABC transporter substrate-binding protein [Lachnospiraceae bacterium]